MSHFIEVEPGIKVHVEDIGQGQPVVFVHAWPLNSRIFEQQAVILAQNGFRFIGIDLRGYGKSDKPWSGYDFNRMAHDIKAVIDFLQLKNIILAGYSIGGPITIRYLNLFGEEGVEKLLLMAAAAPSYTKRKNFKYGKNRSEVDLLISHITQDRPRQMALYAKMYFNKRKSSEFLAWFQSLGLQAGAHSMIHSMIALRDDDVLGELGAVTLPTAIFHGKKDRSCPFDLARELNKRLSNSVLVPFHASGHGLYWDEPQKFNKEMMRFFKSSGIKPKN
ncbi:pimeloyl-ACP methyl ester carboxylesterase [Planomicrobium soli]|uniref:Pimeloyl-ACP methyl ester carboxylesterase n=1 Tax=Planomicrobium soli TaxID=1176648 RepID=A0A2P8H6F8_9BACL|nr:alpha/beta hydrolase [Planomicrobium soli]PSL41791.1 pimeloyl-ACP methyl ester carboxylesterase [Planomicrobium soli]